MTMATSKLKLKHKTSAHKASKGRAAQTRRLAPAVTTSKVDSKGRVSLGKAFANSLVIIRSQNEDVVEIVRAEAIPAREAWLYKNPQAYESVRRGLEQAARGELVEGPDLEAGAKLADEIEE